MQQIEQRNEQHTEENLLGFLFDGIEVSQDISPLKTGDIYGRFDYEEPLLLLQERRLKHVILELRAGRPVDALAPLTQLAMSLGPTEISALLGDGPDWAHRTVMLRLAHLGATADASEVQRSILHDETMSCVVALGEQVRRHPQLREEAHIIRAALLRGAAGASCKRVPGDPRQVIQEMILARHGSRTWYEVMHAAEQDLERLHPEDRGLDVLGVRLIERGAQLLNRSRDEFLHDILGFCNEMVGRIPGASVEEVFANLNEMHKAVARVAPNYPLPSFTPDHDAVANSYLYDATSHAPWAPTIASKLSRRFDTVVHLRPSGSVESDIPCVLSLVDALAPVSNDKLRSSVARSTVAA